MKLRFGTLSAPLVAMALVGFQVPAAAALLSYSITGDATASFTLDTAKKPWFNGFAAFFFDNETVLFNGTESMWQVGFADGAIFLNTIPATTNPSGIGIRALGGQTLFSGSLSAPTLLTGSFTGYSGDYLRSDGTLGTGGKFSVKVSQVATVPEASSWMFAITALVGLGASMRVRRRRSLSST